MEMIESVCIGCGVTFYQPADPGRRAEYHDGPCRSRTWREQQAARMAVVERDWQLGWARDADRRYREKVRQLTRAGKEVPAVDAPLWTIVPGPEDTREQKRYRRICHSIAVARAVGVDLDLDEAERVLRTVRRTYKL